jgi:hypothetical protein
MEDNNEMIIAATKKPAKGRGGTRNFPSTKMEVKTDEDRALVSKLLTEVLVEYRKERVKSDEELMERLSDYFMRCAESGQIPTVEEMCLSTGYTYATCYDWETGRNHGFSSDTSNIIKKAKEMLKTFDAKLVISGKLNFLAYCFRAKNYYGMVDKQEYVVTPNVNNDSDYDADAIKKRYLTDSTTLPLDSENDS